VQLENPRRPRLLRRVPLFICPSEI
jgi:hypothetical protein